MSARLSFISLFIIVTVIWTGIAFLPRADAYVWQDEKSGSNVSVFGLGMLRLNYATVEGDAGAFAESDDGFDEGVDSHGFASFTLNGTLFHQYGLEGFLRYDEDDDDDEDEEGDALSFLFKLFHDDSYVAFGDQANMFSENYFTRYVSPFRGLTFHAESEYVNATTYGALAQGSVEKDEIRADGTSGPYDLEHPPVVPASEVIVIEVRNRSNLNQTIERTPQTRNEDYTIDYDSGEIRFRDPVDRETFHGDPLFIVVTYRTEEESSAFSMATGGANLTVSPAEWVSVGATYLTEFAKDPSLADGMKNRQQIYGLNGAFNISNVATIAVEYAASQDQQHLENTPDRAFKATADAQLSEAVEIHGAFHRTERDFLTFANPDVNPNEQELDVMGKYTFLATHALEIGYYMFQDNIPQDTADPTLTTHNPYIAYDATIREHTQVYSRYEYLQNRDDLTGKKTDDQTNMFLIGVEHDFSNVPAVKKLNVKAEYERDNFEDFTNQETDTITHQAVARAETEPFRQTVFYAQQRERWIQDKTLNDYTERQDISKIGVDFDALERLSLTSSYEYRVDRDLLADAVISKEHRLIFATEYQPFESFETYGKIEFRRDTSYDDPEADVDGNSSEGVTVTGRIVYHPWKDLTMRLTYDLDQEKDVDADRIETLEDEAEFRVNYALNQRRTRLVGSILMERDLLDAPPTPEAKTRTMTYFFSASQQFNDDWDALASYKREQVDIDAENYREDVLGEVGWKMSRFIKTALGYQYSIFRDRYAPETDYITHSVFLRLIGKL